ncbi:HlyD family efflux transporter periplasmic adaptor subunit [Butyricicoccus faecihominis]|uniref:efflux RND transporter periplasmic adaptor subunit n=1 Tax=Butyricicoccus faecihominis TaxID=1712515 RepID=UPI00247B0174|nr:HlyD family efflux transporter periplasmic adaptor subunit [Butyricicoccus faecihominis]MCQ5129844.1 HlyD family efflux transporter periplasmic adaptor subunit [Butyricicoccus faecihominis]
MSEENKQQNPPEQKGGAHVAKAGTSIAKSAKGEVAVPEETLPAESAPATEGEESPASEGPKRNKYADKMNKKKHKLSRGVRIGITVLIIALLIGLGIFLVMRSRKPADDGAASKTAFATRGMLETYIEGEGYTAAKKREELGKDLKGKVSKVLVEVGDEVKKNDQLLVVDPTETRKELTTAQEELADAQRAVATAQSDVTKALNKVSAAQKDLGKLTITAPFSGKIIPGLKEDGSAAPEFKVGQQISSGQVIGYMVDDSSMKLTLYFSTAYMSDIQSGQEATVSIPSAMSEVTGKVSSIEQAEKVSAEGVKLFRAIITVDNPGTLTDGMNATAVIKTAAGDEVYPAESGTLKYSREEAITAEVSGEITSVGGIDYYNYSSGAVIMRLTSDSAQNDVKDAQSDVVSARNNVTTAQKTVKTKQDRITELKKLIENATIKSPIDGVVVSLPVSAGQDVEGTSALCVVADLSDIIVNAQITATDVSAVQPGQMATMTMYTNDGEAMLTGTVESVSMEATKDQSGGQGSMPTFPAVITLDPMEGQTLRSDYPVQYKITTAQSMDCVMVPSSAVVNTEEGAAVFAKPAEGETFENALPLPEGTDVPPEFVLVPVEVGIADAANTEILWGIDEGAEVYLAGPDDLYAEMNDSMTVAVG